MNAQRVYLFGNGKADGHAGMRELLGGKGANLAEMTKLGIPVPPGFTISTPVCHVVTAHRGVWPAGLEAEIRAGMKRVEQAMGKRFGEAANPLLVSVRSGSAVSMPGMMDTILNLGLNDATVEGLWARSGNPRFAYDAYRRFIQMFGNVVLGIAPDAFERLLERAKERQGVTLDTQLSVGSLKGLVREYKGLVLRERGREFPLDPWDQLKLACDAVFASWGNDRAVTYRNLYKIPHTLGTAVNVQAMVFGNLGPRSGTGVCFTRSPSTGENVFYGEYLVNAQGEDVVAGIRTPEPIGSLQREMPAAYKQLVALCRRVERHFRDMQDMEFTIEDGTLYVLQTRNGKRTAASAVRIAVDMVKERLIDRRTALLRIRPEQLDQLLHPMIDPQAKRAVIARGLPASPGAACGQVVFDAATAEDKARNGHSRVILVRRETSPEDIGGMAVAQGILTARGGMTSHAAVVGRGMGKCCVVGCTELQVQEAARTFSVGSHVIREGDFLTLDGSTGEVMLGEMPLVQPKMTASFKQLLAWADAVKGLTVRANADTPADARLAREFGARGIGLTRTEHMFFGPDRLPVMRLMILADDTERRAKVLKRLLPFQRDDFIGIFREMAGLPVTIRLFDPPLHEFLPEDDAEIQRLAGELEVSPETLHRKVASLKEINPMLGHRGCRLGVTFPEIYAVQTQAIIEAACTLAKAGQKVVPEIMIPLVGHVNELRAMRALVVKTAEETLARIKRPLTYRVGTMIEVPRAALTADEIATEADFFSFGTNDLTQMTFGFSRDDIGSFLPLYLNQKLLAGDPFMSLDQAGVGELVRQAVVKGRRVKPDLKVGICGEHGGDPASIEFCHAVGLSYVSCSPFRVPIARLAAAQAVLRNGAVGAPARRRRGGAGRRAGAVRAR